MPDSDAEQTGLPNVSISDATQSDFGYLHIEEAEMDERQQPEVPVAPVSSAKVKPVAQAIERPGTVDHLAARRATPSLKADSPEVKERLVTLRSEMTKVLTELRWEGKSVEETADRVVSLLNVGSILQWRSILLPFLLEIDRAGNLVPVWLKLIERGDPTDLPPGANPAETVEGRARRYAILMLGFYSSVNASEQSPSLGFSKPGPVVQKGSSQDITDALGNLVTDPNTSMYAAPSLVKQGTTSALQALVGALREATGWAKVDVVEAILSLHQERFYDILIASGFDNAAGLESYIAIPIYRTIPLERYLRAGSGVSSRLTQQAALIFGQVLMEAVTPPRGDVKTLPVLFERDMAALSTALFEGTRSNPMWQNTIALHRLALLMGRYWQSISKQELRDTRIIDPIYRCLPMMNEVERWMAGPGRDVLLKAVDDLEGEALMPVAKALGDLRDPRAVTPLIKYVEGTKVLTNRSHALAIGTIIDALGVLGDRRALQPLQDLVGRTVDTERRRKLPLRADNLPTGDSDIPGSVIYAACVRALGHFNDRVALDMLYQATRDVDPYVRTQGLEALRRLDPAGSDTRSRQVVRDALNDPREANVRIACDLILQYRDLDAIPVLQQQVETHPQFAPLLYNTLHQLRQ
jgi:HEAT repeats/PBS lyase HEAT-like repeat